MSKTKKIKNTNIDKQKLWNEFEVNEDDIPSDVFVYKY